MWNGKGDGWKNIKSEVEITHTGRTLPVDKQNLFLEGGERFIFSPSRALLFFRAFQPSGCTGSTPTWITCRFYAVRVRARVFDVFLGALVPNTQNANCEKSSNYVRESCNMHVRRIFRQLCCIMKYLYQLIYCPIHGYGKIHSSIIRMFLFLNV